VHFSEPVFPDERPEDILNLLLNARVARFGRRHDDVLSLEELMLHPIVEEPFELLECHKRPGAHVFMIQAAKNALLQQSECPGTFGRNRSCLLR
jgi:hypothetical protein